MFACYLQLIKYLTLLTGLSGGADFFPSTAGGASFQPSFGAGSATSCEGILQPMNRPQPPVDHTETEANKGDLDTSLVKVAMSIGEFTD